MSLQLPFSSSVVALYLFGLDQQLRSPAAMVLVHAALKWFHSFVPDDGPNPLDNACCNNLIECPKPGQEAIRLTRKSPWTLLSLEALLPGMALRKHL